MSSMWKRRMFSMRVVCISFFVLSLIILLLSYFAFSREVNRVKSDLEDCNVQRRLISQYRASEKSTCALQESYIRKDLQECLKEVEDLRSDLVLIDTGNVDVQLDHDYYLDVIYEKDEMISVLELEIEELKRSISGGNAAKVDPYSEVNTQKRW